MKNFWIDNRKDSTFSINNKKGIEILPLHDVKLSYLNSNKVEILFTDDDFDQNSLLDVDGTVAGYLTYYNLAGGIETSWTLYGLNLEDIDWCEITKPYMTVLPLVTFSFKSKVKQ